MEITSRGGFSGLEPIISDPLGQGSAKRYSPDINSNGRLVKGGVDVVDGYGVIRIRSVAADVDYHAQASVFASSNSCLTGDEVWDLGGQINAVDKDINVQNLRERASLCSLCHVPLEDIIPGLS